MSDLSIPEVSTIPKVSKSNHVLERTHKNPSGDIVVSRTTFTATVYDHSGKLITTHNNYTVNYLI